MGYADRYKEDLNFEHNVKMLTALAFIPPIDVPKGFEIITEAHGQDLPFELLAYFECTWVGQRIGLAPRHNPDYPIYLWNARTATLDLAPRTTNALEGWHQGLKSTIDGTHPSVWNFFRGLQALQSTSELRIVHATDLLQDVTPRKKYKDRALRLQELARSYDSENVLSYLCSIAHLLKI